MEGAAASLPTTGAKEFGFAEDEAPQPSAPPPLSVGEGPDTLVLKVSQDAYGGGAQYTVKVDGLQVGGTFTASALKSSGQSDALTLKGDWGPGEHEVEVTFLNDAWGGTADTDRNLYVDGATYNGQAVVGAEASLWDNHASSFTFTEAAATPTPQPPAVTREGTEDADLFDTGAEGGVFTGGGGRDLFLFEAGDGHVTITDFAPRADKLLFVGLGAEDVTAEQGTEGGAPGLLASYGEGGTVFLAGVSALADRDMAFG